MTVGRKFVKDEAGVWGPQIDEETGDWKKEEGLDTVIRLLIGTEARAAEYEVSQEINRRGNIIDEHSETDGYSLGSKVWLKEQSRNTQRDLNDTVEYARTALSVLVPDLYQSISVEGSRDGSSFTLDIQLQKYDNTTDNVLYEIAANTGL